MTYLAIHMSLFHICPKPNIYDSDNTIIESTKETSNVTLPLSTVVPSVPVMSSA